MTDARTAAVRAAVEALADVDRRMAASRRSLLAELDRLPKPFDRDADPTHLTASAIVVSERGVVLHRHRRMGIWLQPGGHIDPGEPPEDAAVRETIEETGLAAAHPPGGPQLIHVDVHATTFGHVHLDLRYLLCAPPDEPSPPPEESQTVCWFSWEAAVDLADPGLRGALVSLRDRRGA